MTRRIALTVIAGLCAQAALAADANFSGHWVLNIKESSWGQKKKPPHNASVDIHHDGSSYKYNGQIQQSLEGEPVRYSFTGSIDGKEYRVKENDIERKVVINRKGSHSLESTTSSLDGTSTETAVTTISHDGKRLTRRMTLKAPEGAVSWVEVYDKQ